MISYSAESDAVYIQLTDDQVAHTRVFDDQRIVDYNAAWQVVGVEILGASAGIDLQGLPERPRLAQEISVLTFPIVA